MSEVEYEVYRMCGVSEERIKQIAQSATKSKSSPIAQMAWERLVAAKLTKDGGSIGATPSPLVNRLIARSSSGL